MDEPTASLSAAEGEKLFRIVEDLSASGVAVLYVSHRLDEVLRLCHRVTAFRDGRSVAEIARADLHARRAGPGHRGPCRSSGSPNPRPGRRPETSRSAVRGLARHPRVAGVSFDLRRGEVLGIGGLVGAGRTELARLIYGADRTDAGTMTLDGRPFAPRSPAAAVKAGLGLVPEERRAEGLLLTKSVAFNLQLANLGRVVHGPALPVVDGRRRPHAARRPSSATSRSRRPVSRRRSGGSAAATSRRWSSAAGCCAARRC